MKSRLIAKLRCIKCGHGKLQLKVISETKIEIVEGYLTCPLCSTLYEIKDCVPLLHHPSLSLRMKQAVQSELLLSKMDEVNLIETDKLAEWEYYDIHLSQPDELQNLTYGMSWSWKPANLENDIYNFHLNRVLNDLGIPLQGKHIIDMGCGTGKVAEHFIRMNRAIVTGLDIAPGAVRTALKRSKNFNYNDQFDGVAGDMECIPFQDKSFDFALVTTALHHVPNWRIAIEEMIRVAREGIIIDESVDAAVIRLAVSLGFSSDFEEEQSGNRVVRFKKSTLLPLLKELGAKEPQFKRYWLNTSQRFRWLTIFSIKLRPLMRIFESEALLRIQSILFDRIGNRFTVFAKL